MEYKPKKKRGLGAMDPEKARLIQSKGGKATPNNFKHNPELQRRAARLGGLASAKKRHVRTEDRRDA
jgi:general stress protein YciG